MAKIKITITIDEEAYRKAQEDAERDDRSLSGHINRLIKEYGAEKKSDTNNDTLNQILQLLQDGSKNSARAGRPRKPGTITIKSPEGERFLILKNKRKKKMLIVDAPAYSESAEYIKTNLENGTFEHDQVQQDFLEECDSFEVFGALGTNLEDVKTIYAGYGEFYDGWLDLSYIEPIKQSVSGENNSGKQETQKKLKSRKATIKQVLAIDWNAVEYENIIDQFKKISSNQEVEQAVQEFIDSNYPEDFAPTADQLDPCEMLTIMQEFQAKYKS